MCFASSRLRERLPGGGNERCVSPPRGAALVQPGGGDRRLGRSRPQGPPVSACRMVTPAHPTILVILELGPRIEGCRRRKQFSTHAPTRRDHHLNRENTSTRPQTYPGENAWEPTPVAWQVQNPI